MQFIGLASTGSDDDEEEEEETHSHRALPRFVIDIHIFRVEWVICEMIIMRIYAPVFIFSSCFVAIILFGICAILYWCLLSFHLRSYIIFFSLSVGSLGELVLIYLFLTLAIYIKQTTVVAHSKKTAVSCIEHSNAYASV